MKVRREAGFVFVSPSDAAAVFPPLTLTLTEAADEKLRIYLPLPAVAPPLQVWDGTSGNALHPVP